jgi:hypothetical protein
MEEFFRDFDWDLNRFVEYRSPFTRKETLPMIKKPNLDFRVGTEIVFDLLSIHYIFCFLYEYTFFVKIMW